MKNSRQCRRCVVTCRDNNRLDLGLLFNNHVVPGTFPDVVQSRIDALEGGCRPPSAHRLGRATLAASAANDALWQRWLQRRVEVLASYLAQGQTAAVITRV